MSDLDSRLKIDVDYKSISSRGPVFSDSKFPAGNRILGTDPDMHDIIRNGVKWLRTTEVFKNAKLFKGVDIDDVVQNNLGSCYYIAAITGVSEVPNRITKLFLVDKENRYGCYAVNLYICGSYRTIVLDDFFPYVNRQWPFTSSREEEIWVMLMEKAWAKAHGDFSIIIGGDSRESLTSLTGAPSTIIYHNTINKNDFWKILIESTKKKYVMSAGGAPESRGLVPGHAYSLLKAIEVNSPSRGTVKLVQIRNPWGSHEWNGNWSDKSSCWDADLRRQAGHVVADDGTFFMSIDDYFSSYRYSFVCQCVDSYIHTECVVKEDEACVAFQITSETTGFFCAHQMTPRLLKTQQCKPLYFELYSFRDQNLNLVKTRAGEFKPLNYTNNPAGPNALGISTIEATLPPGVYVMHAFYYRGDKTSVRYICFTSYASKAVDLIHLKGKTSVKSLTKADLMNALNSYVSTNNIIPPEKQVIAGTAYNCPEGHTLTYSESHLSNFRCDLCRSERVKGRYRCKS